MAQSFREVHNFDKSRLIFSAIATVFAWCVVIIMPAATAGAPGKFVPALLGLVTALQVLIALFFWRIVLTVADGRVTVNVGLFGWPGVVILLSDVESVQVVGRPPGIRLFKTLSPNAAVQLKLAGRKRPSVLMAGNVNGLAETIATAAGLEPSDPEVGG